MDQTLDQTTEEAVSLRFSQVKQLADEIIKQMHEVALKLGFDASEVKIKPANEAEYRLEKDVSNGKYGLVGDWRDERGMKLGTLMFHPDGSFFVEHDIILPHPTKSKWFVEAVNAWGRDSVIKAEARLLRLPDEDIDD